MQAGEQAAYWHQLTQAQLDSRYTTYVSNSGYAIGDFFAYRVVGVQYYSVLFTTSTASSNWLTYGGSVSQVQTAVAAIPAGLQLAQVVADTTTSEAPSQPCEKPQKRGRSACFCDMGEGTEKGRDETRGDARTHPPG